MTLSLQPPILDHFQALEAMRQSLGLPYDHLVADKVSKTYIWLIELDLSPSFIPFNFRDFVLTMEKRPSISMLVFLALVGLTAIWILALALRTMYLDDRERRALNEQVQRRYTGAQAWTEVDLKPKGNILQDWMAVLTGLRVSAMGDDILEVETREDCSNMV